MATTTLRTTTFFPDREPASALAELVRLLRPLYLWYSPDSDEEEMRGRYAGHSNSAVDIVFDRSAPVAFGVSYPMTLSNGEVCLFRGGTLVSDDYRSNGLYHELIRRAMDRNPNATLTATRTQNPRVYEAWLRRYGAELFPRHDAPAPPGILALAREIGAPLEVGDDLVIRQIYRHDRTGLEYHRCRDERIAQFFADSLGIYDAFQVVARLR